MADLNMSTILQDIVDAVRTTVEQILTVPGQRRPRVTALVLDRVITIYGDDIWLGSVPIYRIKANLQSYKGFIDLLKKSLAKGRL